MIAILSGQLDKRLCYHNTEHTLDVISQSEQIALSERVSSSKELLLLKIAALFHDTGFLHVYNGHEEKSCEIAVEKLNSHFTKTDMEVICGLIMAATLLLAHLLRRHRETD